MKKITFVVVFFSCFYRTTCAQTCTGIDVAAMSTDATYSGYTELPSSGDYNTASANYKVTGNTSISGFNFGAANITIVVLSGATLTLGNYNANDGPIGIIVQSGGKLVIDQSDLKGNSSSKPLTYTIYGSMVRTGDLTMQNSARLLVGPSGTVAVTGLFNMSGGTADVVIEGSVGAGSANVQSSNICLDKSGCFNVTGTFDINTTSAFVAPTDATETGFLRLEQNDGQRQLNNGVSLSDKLTVCTNASSCYRTNCGGSYSTTSGCSTGPLCSPWPNASVNSAGCSPTVPAKCKSAVALPIILTYFRTSISNEGVLAKWGTNSQWDSDYFKVEKSQNGIDWEDVSSIPSQNGKYSYKEFSVVDPNPYSGDSYYRLIEVDTKGKQTVYAIDFVQNDRMFSGFSVYPNPSNGIFVVNISGEYPQYDFEILDIMGNRYSDFILYSGKNDISSNLKSGVYLAKLKVGPDYYTQKLIVK